MNHKVMAALGCLSAVLVEERETFSQGERDKLADHIEGLLYLVTGMENSGDCVADACMANICEVWGLSEPWQDAASAVGRALEAGASMERDGG